MNSALDARITEEFFQDEEHRKVWGWCLEYYASYAKPPTGRALKDVFPEYKLVKTEEPLLFYVDRVKENRKQAIVYSMLQEAMRDPHDPEAVLATVSRGLMLVGQEISNLKYENLIDTFDERIQRYKELKNLPGGMRGYPIGWPSIDHALSGIQPEQLIVMVGPPKAGKSTAMMHAAISTHMWGQEPIFWSFEMSNDEQAARYDAMRAHINYQHLLTGKMTRVEEQKLQSALSKLKNMQRFILGSDITSATTVSGIAAKLDEYRPTVAFIDGVYLMDDEQGEPKGSPQALTNITRSLKRLAQSRQIPIVISTQILESRYSRSRGIRSSGVGYSSSFAQDNDAMIGVERIEEPNQPAEVKISIVHARNAPSLSVRVDWDWTTSTFNEIDDTEGVTANDYALPEGGAEERRLTA